MIPIAAAMNALITGFGLPLNGTRYPYNENVEGDVVVIFFSKTNHIRLFNSSSQITITASAVKTSYLAEGIW